MSQKIQLYDIKPISNIGKVFNLLTKKEKMHLFYHIKGYPLGDRTINWQLMLGLCAVPDGTYPTAIWHRMTALLNRIFFIIEKRKHKNLLMDDFMGLYYNEKYFQIKTLSETTFEITFHKATLELL